MVVLLTTARAGVLTLNWYHLERRRKLLRMNVKTLKSLYFYTIPKLVVPFEISASELGSWFPFMHFWGMPYFRKETTWALLADLENKCLEPESCTIEAASKVGLFMQIVYLYSQFFPCLRHLFSISSVSGIGFHSCVQSHSHTDAILCSKHWALQGILVFLCFRSIFM